MSTSPDNPRRAAPPVAGPPPSAAVPQRAAPAAPPPTKPAAPDTAPAWTDAAKARVLDANQHTVSAADFADLDGEQPDAADAFFLPPATAGSVGTRSARADEGDEVADGYRVEAELSAAQTRATGAAIVLPHGATFHSMFTPESELVRERPAPPAANGGRS
ncbi:MAG: hypothetical protein SF069_13030 [Phycisphaerae bacterium]|nr:hypothetical protein [Phycisphaerae bacterium]